MLTPEREWELRDPFAYVTGHPSPTAMVFSDGVFFDATDELFKMWYMAGYQQHTALALSRDGIAWTRPSLDVVPGTNIVFNSRRDSSTVWLDHEARDQASGSRWPATTSGSSAFRLHLSPDGVQWREVGQSGTVAAIAARSSPIRFAACGPSACAPIAQARLTRYRQYCGIEAFGRPRWTSNEPVAWAGADSVDLQRADLRTAPQLYNLDAVAYESLMLGLFTIYRGEHPDREKPNDICVGFSRDGFHWSRDRSRCLHQRVGTQGDWNWANVQSAGGGCLIVGDTLHFYVSGRRASPARLFPARAAPGSPRFGATASLRSRISSLRPPLVRSRPRVAR